MHADAAPLNEHRCYISIARDAAVLSQSTSGGIGYELALYALNQGMPVCGVTYSTSEERAKHIILHSEEMIRLIQGSKYMQSASADAFREISAQSSGMIFGTPCQIAGMDRVLTNKNKRDQFILVDIFCHGVPSQLLWDNHLNALKHKKKIETGEKVRFRDGKAYKLKIGAYSAWYNQDAFYTFFLRGWLFGTRCYACHLRRHSGADIRIGDCMTQEFERMAHSPSCIIVNTERGAIALESCEKFMEQYIIPYSIIDGVQEKENKPIPVRYEERLQRLKQGCSPESLIRMTMAMGRIKAFIRSCEKHAKHKQKNISLQAAVLRIKPTIEDIMEKG